MTTDDNVEMRSEYLLNIVKLLSQLETLTVDVKKWTSNDNIFVTDNQIEMIIDKFMPRLRYFYCSIQTKCNIDMTVRFIHLSNEHDLDLLLSLQDFYRIEQTLADNVSAECRIFG